ncbi:TRAP transporter small permease [Puniceibacterium sp. IMCC21224]|uniref:TRAP transporter small permease n=1 Tax=Puniceibacterium sp. IMCC21224 TaxID=1618204 RepID=UPI00064DC05C|nr:TRAP transporter small permease [Puniceibacterium sp. IMCC21224]KMK66554.1 TRAP-type C4-dicarboxylate transport system, small permease component [Puniceibacterium sp. IMCC21224]
MPLLTRLRDRGLDLLAVLGGLAILTLMIHVVADVAMRNLLNQPIPATYEVVTHYYMIALAFLPLAWLERRRGMVQVEVLEPLMSPALLRLSDRFVALLSTVIYAALAWVTWKTALGNYATGTFVLAQNVAVPTWPAYFLPPLGFALAAAVTAVRILSPEQDNPA